MGGGTNGNIKMNKGGKDHSDWVKGRRKKPGDQIWRGSIGEKGIVKKPRERGGKANVR